MRKKSNPAALFCRSPYPFPYTATAPARGAATADGTCQKVNKLYAAGDDPLYPGYLLSTVPNVRSRHVFIISWWLEARAGGHWFSSVFQVSGWVCL